VGVRACETHLRRRPCAQASCAGCGRCCRKPVQGQALHFSAAPRGWRIGRAYYCQSWPHPLAEAGWCSRAGVSCQWGRASAPCWAVGCTWGHMIIGYSWGLEWEVKRLVWTRRGSAKRAPALVACCLWRGCLVRAVSGGGGLAAHAGLRSCEAAALVQGAVQRLSVQCPLEGVCTSLAASAELGEPGAAAEGLCGAAPYFA
jgi:hypothetical protein